MLKRVAPQAQKIGALANEAKIEMACMVHRKIAPALKFERDDLRWLGVMGARLDIDIYILNEQQKPSLFGSQPAAPTTGSGSGETSGAGGTTGGAGGAPADTGPKYDG